MRIYSHNNVDNRYFLCISASSRNSGISVRSERTNGNRDSVSTTTSALTLGGAESVPGMFKYNQGSIFFENKYWKKFYRN